MTRAEVAWLAGLLEGEGSFLVKPRAAIQLVMTDLDIVERLPRLTGVGHVYPYRPKAAEHYKDAHMWSVVKQRHVLAVTIVVRPWLGERRGAAADAMLAWLASRSPTRIRT